MFLLQPETIGPGVEREIVPLNITPRDPIGKVLLPVSATLSFADVEILVLEWGGLLPVALTDIPLNWKLRLPLITLDF